MKIDRGIQVACWDVWYTPRHVGAGKSPWEANWWAVIQTPPPKWTTKRFLNNLQDASCLFCKPSMWTWGCPCRRISHSTCGGSATKHRLVARCQATAVFKNHEKSNAWMVQSGMHSATPSRHGVRHARELTVKCKYVYLYIYTFTLI